MSACVRTTPLLHSSVRGNASQNSCRSIGTRVFVYHRHSLCRVRGFIMSDSPQIKGQRRDRSGQAAFTLRQHPASLEKLTSAGLTATPPGQSTSQPDKTHLGKVDGSP
ncbi:hypothetical protein DPX16_19125 [Anabarilius grahami]|uniref:Uncharacterized protein n=1 Tax=Anabarilius grahami TaxID=495550 RepID=A0A3N0YZ81_ANAGA|nr:hypothetical protein DPX16_19125 [Anabarilius grahami]